MQEKKGFALKVFAGIIVGILLGLLLLFTLPVGLQPGDTLTATLSDDSTVEIVLPDGTSAGPVSIDGTDSAESVKTAGVPIADAPAVINEALGTDIQSLKVKDRAGVKVRPVVTEIIYVGGQIFLRLLKMLIVPLIIATVLIGIASLGDIKKLGRLGGMTAMWYIGTMLVATVIGLTMVNLISPGAQLASQWSGLAKDGAIADKTASELILRIIPTNPIQAIATLDVVGMLFFTILFALAMLAMGKRRTAPVYNFFEGLNDIVFVLVGWVMTLAPWGVGFLIAHTVATQDVAFLGTMAESLGKFALCVTAALLLHWLFLLTMVKVFGKYNPVTFVKQMTPAMSVAFGTNSSSATLPVTMECIETMGVSKRVRNFVAPVGATLNMDGTALFEAVSVLFFAQAFGVHLSLGMQIVVALTAVVAAMGAAGIPSAGLVTMTLVLSAVGLPASKVGLLWAIDRPLDMMRTVVNITGDAVTCRIVQTLNPDLRPEDDDLAEEYEPIDPAASHDV